MDSKRVRVIGLTGKAGAGKDTAATAIPGALLFAFAAQLKRTVQSMFGFSAQQLTDPELKEVVDERWALSPRQVLQIFGTDLVKPAFGDDFWVRRLKLDLEAGIEHFKPNLVIITDVRFPEEVNFVQDLGGVVVRIERDGISRAGQPDTFAHSSENHTFNADYTIKNDGTVDELRTKMRNLMEELYSE